MIDDDDNRLREARATFKMDSGAETNWGMSHDLSSAAKKHYRAKVFKSGNSLALRLPAGLGLEAGMEMDLKVLSDGSYSVCRIEAPQPRIDVSGFWGKCPGIKLAPREDFEERPSTIAARALEARKAAEGQ